ncbi:MAG: SIS domain-containing protein [Peptoniphilaceae bacterium]|nr:SIS domain-containing protein [Peptoniphilaceae bacterium]MDY6019017.1 SIS domain-containing protein [Anaerococcus sp.]
MLINQAKEKGGEYTYNEIMQQPDIWLKVYDLYMERKNDLDRFLEEVGSDTRVIFTGAGTSEYVGNVANEYLRSLDNRFESVATTDLVSSPYLHFKKDQKTLLVSFARSGNSPESLAAVELGQQIVDDFYNLAITCAPDGKLAEKLYDDEKAYVFIEPEGTNDKSFAMTSSFSSMLLATLLIFDQRADKEDLVKHIAKLGYEIVDRKEEVEKLVDLDFNRLVYLGSGPLYRLTNEARLKILELTAGEVAAIGESSMGFRHGPKSIINEETVVVSFVSENEYTKLYDLDILDEIHADKIAKRVISISNEKYGKEWNEFVLESKGINDVYLSLVYIMVAQIIGLVTSLKVGNTPDSPSKTKTVNRVVKGVKIHAYK